MLIWASVPVSEGLVRDVRVVVDSASTSTELVANERPKYAVKALRLGLIR